jgi:hypothetical protein
VPHPFLEFLDARAAEGVAHVTGTLAEHLQETEQLLRDWGNPRYICDAGLAHAVYGTSGFPLALLNPATDRGELVRLIGDEAEALVYFYASCDRAEVYPQIGGPEPLQFRDRFDGRIFTPPRPLLSAFMEVTFANELQIAAADATQAEAVLRLYGELFTRSRSLVSPQAYACFERICRPGQAGAA